MRKSALIGCSANESVKRGEEVEEEEELTDKRTVEDLVTKQKAKTPIFQHFAFKLVLSID